MLNAIIIEDERPAMEMLVLSLQDVCPEATVIQRLSSVEESIDYFRQGPAPADLIFSDVQLSDGLSFDIFGQVPTKTPIIFITGYDHFMMNAFDYNGIDYLLKPVIREDLSRAMQKYKMLQQHFTSQNAVEGLVSYIRHKKRTRLLVRKGLEVISLRMEDVVLLYTENKIVFVIDRDGKKYMADKNLSEMAEELDENQFFRANRQYIVNLHYIRGFKAHEKVKLRVDLIPDLMHDIIISQETAPHFRKWMQEA